MMDVDPPVLTRPENHAPADYGRVTGNAVPAQDQQPSASPEAKLGYDSRTTAAIGSHTARLHGLGATSGLGSSQFGSGRDVAASRRNLGLSVDSSREPIGDFALSRQDQAPSSSNSQDTASTTDIDRVFSPPGSDGSMSNGHGPDSSQESQLMQLSELAATRGKMLDVDGNAAGRKRMADGAVKHVRDGSITSPIQRGGHSRNTSTVSVASTTGSRISELSAELKARLSYAMVKVNNGWQAHTIDQVENLASQAASPTSSTSTVHWRHGLTPSPQLSAGSRRGSATATPATAAHHQFSGRASDSTWHGLNGGGLSNGGVDATVKGGLSLAPPVSIQPSRPGTNARRNSLSRQAPSFLAHPHQMSPTSGPHTPGHPSPYLGTPQQRTPIVDPILFSPHQNVREQDAIESLLFMSSPGNSANLKHTFPISASQPLSATRTPGQRTALPSQPRKSLPTGRPTQSQPQPKRVGFEKSPGGLSEMDIDDQFGSPHSRNGSRRKVNGHVQSHSQSDIHSAPRLKHIPASSGLAAPPRPRARLADEEIDRLLDRVGANDSSDSEGEIEIPVPRPYHESNGVGA